VVRCFCRCLLSVHKDNWTSGFPISVVGESEIVQELWESIEADQRAPYILAKVGHFCVAVIHTHTHPFDGWDSEWQWHQLGHVQVCSSLQTDNHASTPPLGFFTDWMPFLPPNQQHQSTEGTKHCVAVMLTQKLTALHVPPKLLYIKPSWWVVSIWVYAVLVCLQPSRPTPLLNFSRMENEQYPGDAVAVLGR